MLVGAQKVQRRRDRGGAHRKLASHRDKSERREDRQQQRDGKQDRPEQPEPRPPTERKMQPEAAVKPARRHQRQLPALLSRRPEIGDHARVVRREPVEIISKPRRRDVADQQNWHRKAERYADELERRQPKGSPFVDRNQRHHEMNGNSAVQQDGAGKAVPDLHGDAHSGFGGLQRNEAERVIDQMCGDVKEKDQAGAHPQMPAYGTGEPFREQWSPHPGYAGGRRAAAARTNSKFQRPFRAPRLKVNRQYPKYGQSAGNSL